MSAAILEKLRSAENLPTLPMVALEVLRLSRSDRASAAEMARTLQHDPALAGKILKVANSALFGMSRQVSSLQQAVTVLGLRTVKVIALTFSLAESVQGQAPDGFDYPFFWRRSLTSAVAARLLAEQIGVKQSEDVFLTALMSDIGMLAAFHADKEGYRKVLAESESSDRPIHVVERSHFGATHESFSSQLLETWGLPVSMVKAVARHHQGPAELPSNDPDSELIRLTAAAGLIADSVCSQSGVCEQVAEQIRQIVVIPSEQLQHVLDVLEKQVCETAAKWSIDVGVKRSSKEIQAEAVVQLAKLTMAMELERAQLAAAKPELSGPSKPPVREVTLDSLTGIADRSSFEQQLEDACGTVSEGRSVGLLLLDLDRFKKLTDTFGHKIGDSALRLLGGYLRELNDSRIFTARYGSQEFAAAILDVSLADLRGLAERIRMEVQQIRIPLRDRQIAITVSIGGAVTNDASGRPTPAGLIECADHCLYQAKETGRNRAICSELPAAAAPSATASVEAPPCLSVAGLPHHG